MQLRVATLNVWALPTPLAEQVSARMQAIADHLSELALDVVCFQEVWTPDARDTLIAGGRAAGLTHVWHNDAAFGGSGLLVLSRLPVEAADFQRYALRGSPAELDQGDFYAGKGFARLRLRTPGGPVHLINTHLHARYAKTVPHEYRALRTGQVVELALAMEKLREPIIVTGDFNFQEHDEGHRVLTGITGARDLAAETFSRQDTVSHHNAYRRGRKDGKRVDYVFARDGKGQRVAARSIHRIFDAPLQIDGHEAAYSNHAGVFAEVAIEPGVGRAHHADPGAVELAQKLLSEGRANARRRQRDRRAWAGASVGCALVATAGGVSTTRRRMLRNALRGAAVLALTPTVGFSLLSEVFVPDELRAFERLSDQLAASETPSDQLIV